MPRAFYLSALIVSSILWPIGAFAAEAEEHSPVLLWPDGAPGAKGQTENDKPWISPWLPAADRATGSAVVICPGGGYAHLAIDKEGYEVAKWLNHNGVAAFVLKYRHRGTGYGYPAPLQDVRRAIRLVRSRANEWHLAPDRIGVMGFSAGGHLASSAGTHFVPGDLAATDPVERMSSRPDFMILIYPVISFIEPYSHHGSCVNLLGKTPDPKLVEEFSNERQVTAQTPPAFLISSSEDRVVPVENSIAFYEALRRAKVPASLHVFEKGRHGFGLGNPGTESAEWPRMAEAWLRVRGILPSTAAKPVK